MDILTHISLLYKDITDKFLEELNQKGVCSYNSDRHDHSAFQRGTHSHPQHLCDGSFPHILACVSSTFLDLCLTKFSLTTVWLMDRKGNKSEIRKAVT